MIRFIGAPYKTVFSFSILRYGKCGSAGKELRYTPGQTMAKFFGTSYSSIIFLVLRTYVDSVESALVETAAAASSSGIWKQRLLLVDAVVALVRALERLASSPESSGTMVSSTEIQFVS